MILGVDHIVYTTDSTLFQKVILDFLELNFKLRFQELSLENPEEKRKFVNGAFCNKMSMSFLDSPSCGVPVEIITHDSVGKVKRNNFKIILGDKDSANIFFSASKSEVEEIMFRSDMNKIKRYRTNAPLKVSCLQFNTHDLKNTLSFWQDILGFSLLNKVADSALLHKNGLNDKWRLSVIISASKTKTPKTFNGQSIDTPGASCVSFISNKIEKDLLKAENAGASIGEIAELKINRKTLLLAFLNAPTGELLEFIQIKGD